MIRSRNSNIYDSEYNLVSSINSYLAIIIAKSKGTSSIVSGHDSKLRTTVFHHIDNFISVETTSIPIPIMYMVYISFTA